MVLSTRERNASQRDRTVQQEEKIEETFFAQRHPDPQTSAPYMPTPTKHGQARPPSLRSDDSFVVDNSNLWYTVSDESFIEMELACQSPQTRRNVDRNISVLEAIDDIEEPSFFAHNNSTLNDSVFEDNGSVTMLSPIKRIGIRRPSTILEESTLQSSHSSVDYSRKSSLLAQNTSDEAKKFKTTKTSSIRPSFYNVFPTRSQIGFLENMESKPTINSQPTKPATSTNQSISLIQLDCSMEQGESDSAVIMPKPLTPRQATTSANQSISLIKFEDTIDEISLSVDQASPDSSVCGSDPPDQFNDTLEAVDFYMRQGKKILDKTAASTTFQQQQQQQACVVMSPRNRNDSLLKQTLERNYLMRACDKTAKALFKENMWTCEGNRELYF